MVNLEFDRLSVPETLEYRIPANHVVLDFWDDVGKDAFCEWFFESGGDKAFAKWCSKYSKYRGLVLEGERNE